MTNKRFLQVAERWMNKEVPSERVQPIIPVQQSHPSMDNESYSFLEGTEGRAILEEYNQRISRDYQGASALNVLSFADNVVKGSNPFAFVLLNKILSQKKMRIATPADLERALEKEAINLKGTYGDSGLVLRSDGDPNQYLARDLIIQVQQRGSLQYPLMIPLAGLDLRYDSNSPYDLSFQLTDFTELIYAPQLAHPNDRARFSKGDEKGLPIFDQNGNRTLYAKNGGLRRLYRGTGFNLYARSWVLDNSSAGSRVIVCREVACAKSGGNN